MNAQLDPLAPTSVARPLLAPELPAAPGALRAAITAAWLKDETEHVRELLDQARLPAAEQAKVQAIAADLVTRVRARAQDQGAIEAFMRQYDLGSEEGVLLMCVAEALLRIPDQNTADKLIRDKLGDADWKKHMGGSDSVLVNASTWGLMLTGQLVQLNDLTRADVPGAFKRLIGRVGEPVIRLAVRQAMKIMGHQFVMGRTIGEALSRSRKGDNANYRYSFDMLGEGALTMKDAQRYLQAYRDAIHAIGRSGSFVGTDVFAAPSISIKLSALYPRYEHAKRARVTAELVPGVLELAQLAKSYGIGYTVDAEEADRLELSLDIIEATFSEPSLMDGRAMAWPCRHIKNARPTRSIFLPIWRAVSGDAFRCAWSKARTGTQRSSAPRSKGIPATRCLRVSRTPTCRTWHAHVAYSRTAMRSTRCSPRTTRRPLRQCVRLRQARPTSTRNCTAWATTSMPK